MDGKKNEVLKRRSKLLLAQQELLKKRLQGEIDSHSQLEIIPRRSQTSPAPLSFAQQRLWFLHQLDPSNSSYNELASIQLTGALNVVAVEQSLNEIVRRHEALRTTFEIVEGQPTQVIHPIVTVTLPVVNLSQLQETKRKAEVEWVTTEVGQKPFQMASGSLFRVTLLQTGELEYLLLFVIHHIAVDGWSIGVLFQELAVLYEAFSTGKTSPLPELSVQYADFAVWERQWMQRELQKTQLSYWKQQLVGAPDVLALPTDHPRPAVQSFRGAIASFKLSPSLSDMLRSLSNGEGVTLFMTLLAAFQTLLYRYTGQEDICIGSPIANRNQTETHGLIGCFVNTLVLRTHLSGNPSFLELLGRVREVCVGAYAHADMPFEQLVEELQPKRNLSHMPLFQVAFAWQEDFQKNLKLSGLTLNLLSTYSQTAKFDLTLHVVDAKPELKVLLEYNTDLFNAKTITRMGEHFRTLLEGIVAYPQTRLSDLPLLTAVELHQQLVEWNDTSTNFPVDVCIHQLFETQVERSPDAIAVVYEDEQLTYRELNARANQLAHHLRSLGVQPEVLVGICVERSLDMIIGLLGILKAGGIYVPLDPTYPQERLSFILKDAQVVVLLTQQKFVSRLADNNAHAVYLDTDWGLISQETEKNPISSVVSLNLAYVIYTSGSTGKPKGAMNTHQGICNRLLWMQEAYQINSTDSVLQKTPFSFDVSVWEFFWTLITGARLVIAKPEGHRDSAYLINLIAVEQITTLHFVPSMLQIFIESSGVEKCTSLKRVICSGEALPIDLQNRFFERLGCELHNLYGPTEAAIDVTFWQCQKNSNLKTVPIGRPIANTQIYILDAYLQPVPIGVIGEIYIGGVGVARGYLNHKELTNEKFIPNYFNNSQFKIHNPKFERFYKTGDLGRYLPDGNIEYVGRSDYQVKIRGYRIEIGEIENVLSTHPQVREAVVITHADQVAQKQLIAYITYSYEKPTLNNLRDFLKEKLPDFMIPAAFAILEALPLTPNGKVDRKALPAPELTQLFSESDFIPPSTPIEEMLAGIWAEVLGIEKIGIYNNFFELGGHSLLATQVISQVRKVFQQELSLRRLFEQPTIAGLAKDIEQATKAGLGLETATIERISRSQQLPLSFAQQRLWFLAQLEPNNPLYNIPAAVLVQGQLNVGALQQSFNEILRRHEVLQTNFQIVEGQPVAVISSVTSLLLPVFDISKLTSNQQQAEVRQLADFEAQQPFNLNSDLLLRVKLLRLHELEHILLLTMHHIASDAWSVGVLVREVATLYQTCCDQQPSPLVELPIQYVDFAAWQRQWLQAEVLQSQISYWKKQLEGAPAILELPTDHPRPAVITFQGASYSFQLSVERSQALNKLSQQQGSTLFMTLLAAFQTLLWRYTGNEDIVVGSPIANRNRQETEGLIGFFVNTLVLRTNLAGNPTFGELLTRVREVALGAYAHQDLPFEQLVEQLQPQRDLSYTPLFQVMFVLQNAPMSALELPGLTLSLLESESRAAKFDLTLYMTETAQGLVGTLEYNTNLLEENTISRMAGHLQTLFEGIVANPQQRLSELSLLTSTEKHQLLEEWNDTAVEYPQQQCIHQLFEAQVERTPNAVAVVFEQEQLTYCELNTRANQLAYYLQQLGVKPEVLVGICVERSLHMIIGLLAILKAGGAYVPLDPSYPKERLAYMLEDSQPKVLLTQQQLVENLPTQTAKLVCLDSNWELIAQHSKQNPDYHPSNDNLAYIIYTSGSTGKPKGAMNTHRGICNRLLWMQDQYQLTDTDRVLQKTPFSFDVSVWEFFWPLITGARLVVAQPEGHRDPNYLVNVIAQQQITTLHFVPSMLKVFLEAEGLEKCQSLMRVIVSGEALPVQLQQRSGDRLNAQLHNLYGPTEAAVDVTFWQCQDSVTNQNTVPIGRPIANIQIYLLDEHFNPVPIGVPGELYIGGVGLARGYFNRPDLTAEKFIPNPFQRGKGAETSPSGGFQPSELLPRGDAKRERREQGSRGEKEDQSSNYSERLYKTGDLARYLPNGEIEFIGRIDYQVKIRGFRIELGEVEALINQYSGVRETVVVATDAQNLVAYVVPQTEQTLIISELRHFLESKLPNYMVPAAFVTLEALPLSPNGKVDRKALRAPDTVRPQLEAVYQPPQTEVEQTIVDIWQEILNLESVGIHDNFFELGGHSLLLVQVHSKLREAFKSNVSIIDLFRYPTIRSLAEYFSQIKNLPQSYLIEIPTEKILHGKVQQRKRLQKLKSIDSI